MSFVCYVEGRVVRVACWRIKKTRRCFIGVYVQKLHNTLVWSLIKCHLSVWRGENWRRRHRNVHRAEKDVFQGEIKQLTLFSESKESEWVAGC